jgi:hypothetical protein
MPRGVALIHLQRRSPNLSHDHRLVLHPPCNAAWFPGVPLYCELSIASLLMLANTCSM